MNKTFWLKAVVLSMVLCLTIEGVAYAGSVVIKGSTTVLPIAQKAAEDYMKMNPDFSPHSLYFRDYQGPLFKSSELGHYQLLPTFPGIGTGIKLPSEIGRLLSQSRRRIGAY